MNALLSALRRWLQPRSTTPPTQEETTAALLAHRQWMLDTYMRSEEPFWLKPNSKEDDAVWHISAEYRSQLEREER